MLYRKVFKIKNSDGHIIGLCWAASQEAAEDFCKNIAPPYELINEPWKTSGYFKILDGTTFEVEEHREYSIDKDNNESYKVTFEDEDFDNAEVYKSLNFKEDESCLLRIVKLYKTDDECPIGGEWLNVSDQTQNCYTGDEIFGTGNEREYFHYIKK